MGAAGVEPDARARRGKILGEGRETPNPGKEGKEATPRPQPADRCDWKGYGRPLKGALQLWRRDVRARPARRGRE
eukprot:312676-Chlamydomonas_euryale.AAC.1